VVNISKKISGQKSQKLNFVAKPAKKFQQKIGEIGKEYKIHPSLTTSKSGQITRNIPHSIINIIGKS